MIHITDKAKCCGCSACAERCPKSCIGMVEDGEGFCYPRVDVDRCIECGLCEKVCPELSPLQPVASSACAAYNLDEAVREESSSGGVFTLLAEKVINEGGVVFGARYDSSWEVFIDGVDRLDDLALFRGSKYVQARVGDAYRSVETKLRAGVPVLFTGTPCQVAGLLHFLRKPYERLLTMEVACHGVPSPKVWRGHLDELGKKKFAGKKIADIKFRYKYDGWKGYRLLYAFRDGPSYSVGRDKDPYLRGFVSSLYSRPSCQHCSFKHGASGADLTVGDLWGSEHIVPNMEDGKGLSFVCVNTDKGKQALPWDKMKSMKILLQDAEKYNDGLHTDNAPHRNRERFFTLLHSALDNMLVDELIEKMLRPTWKERVRMMPRELRGWAWRVKNGLFKYTRG